MPVTIQREICQDIFDDLAQSCYRLLAEYAQYEHYLEFLDIVSFGPSGEETPLLEKPDVPSMDTAS